MRRLRNSSTNPIFGTSLLTTGRRSIRVKRRGRTQPTALATVEAKTLQPTMLERRATPKNKCRIFGVQKEYYDSLHATSRFLEEAEFRVLLEEKTTEIAELKTEISTTNASIKAKMKATNAMMEARRLAMEAQQRAIEEQKKAMEAFMAEIRGSRP